MADGGKRDATTVVPARDRTGQAPRLSLRLVGDAILETFPLPSYGVVVIGRGPESDLRVEHPSISRKHALVAVDGASVRIKDLGSANGTRLADRPLAAGESVELAPGEVVDLGSVMMVLQTGYAGRRARRVLPHDYFEARVEEECERSGRSGAPFAVVRVHIEQRDEASARMTEELLADVLRAADVAALYGPGEYELLLAEADGEQALDVVTRVEAMLRERELRGEVGLAVFPRDGRTPEALVASACRAVATPSDEPAGVVVADPAMERIYRLLRRVAPGQISVLILGETGVGKEVVAELVHKLSPRAAQPFVRLNCGAFTESLLESELFGHEKGAFTGAVVTKPGLLESADGGTVFLDEIGELPPSLQVKLLRVLEDRLVMRVGAVKSRHIDVRFVAATNRNLEDEVERGVFRQDLFYRINGMTVIIPPLRERVGEIAKLARLFAGQAAKRANVAEPAFLPDAMALLEGYSWPGNIRELRNVIERAVLLAGGDPIAEEHLPREKMTARSVIPGGGSGSVSAGQGGGSLHQEVDDLERRRILSALETCAGNQTRAARMLGISRGTLAARLEQYGIPRPRKR